jgi:hypothetical protein
MPTFKITTSTPSVHFDYYEVEALHPNRKRSNKDLIWKQVVKRDSYDTVNRRRSNGIRNSRCTLKIKK